MPNSDLFRKSALNKLSSPEQLDKTLTIIKPHSWPVVCALFVLLTAIVIWSITGSIPEKVSGQGVLLNSGGLVGISYASEGIVKDVFLENGEEVQKGQILARIERQDLLEQLQLASQKVSNLQQDYDTTLNLSTKSSYVTDEMIKNLRVRIANISEQIELAQLKEQRMKVLYDEGQTTESAFLESRNELLSLQRHKQEAEQQLISTKVTNTRSTGETKQQLLSLQHQLEEAKKQLDIQQQSYQNATRIISPVSGTIYEVSISKGSFISPGSNIAVIEPFSSDGSALQAVIYFPVKDAKRIKLGMNIAICPSTVKQEEYGYIQGIVTSVSEFPVSNQYLLSSLQNQGLAQNFENIGTPIEVKVSLIPDPSTTTGFRWSSSKGPNITLETGVLCLGSVTVRNQKPIEFVIPLMKKKLLGIGE